MGKMGTGHQTLGKMIRKMVINHDKRLQNHDKPQLQMGQVGLYNLLKKLGWVITHELSPRVVGSSPPSRKNTSIYLVFTQIHVTVAPWFLHPMSFVFIYIYICRNRTEWNLTVVNLTEKIRHGTVTTDRTEPTEPKADIPNRSNRKQIYRVYPMERVLRSRMQAFLPNISTSVLLTRCP